MRKDQGKYVKLLHQWLANVKKGDPDRAEFLKVFGADENSYLEWEFGTPEQISVEDICTAPKEALLLVVETTTSGEYYQKAILADFDLLYGSNLYGAPPQCQRMYRKFMTKMFPEFKEDFTKFITLRYMKEARDKIKEEVEDLNDTTITKYTM